MVSVYNSDPSRTLTSEGLARNVSGTAQSTERTHVERAIPERLTNDIPCCFLVVKESLSEAGSRQFPADVIGYRVSFA